MKTFFSWLISLPKEDKVNRAGWKWFRLFQKRKDDPYHDAAVWHDRATSNGSWHQDNLTPEQIQKAFEAQLDEIDKRTGRDPNNTLKKFYKWITRNFTWLFSENKKRG